MENNLPPLPPKPPVLQPKTLPQKSLPPKPQKTEEKIVSNKITKKDKVKKPIIEKIKKEKLPKIEKSNGNDKKTISKKTKIILFVSLFAVVIVGGIVLTFILIKNNTKLETPAVSVYALSNQTIISVDENEKALGYEFYIENVEINHISTILSNESEISIVSYLKNPGKYLIWAKCVGETANNKSDSSQKVEYKYYQNLNIPIIIQSSNILRWAPIPNADNYRLYYGVGNNNVPKYITINKDGLKNLEFDLSSLDAGNYDVFITAYSNNQYYLESGISDKISYTKKIANSSPTNVQYNKSTNILKFDIDNQTCKSTQFIIDINNETMVFGYNTEEIRDNYTIDLTPYITELNVTVISVKSVGNGDFILDSDYTVAEIN